MNPLEISEKVYLVGAIDWNRRNFHGSTYSTRTGTTYNAYLIVDDKITLVDTVMEPFAGEMIGKIRRIISPEKIDHIIINHGEMDHSGALPALLELCPKAKVFGTAKCRETLERHYGEELNFSSVKSGDYLDLGKRRLTFIEAAMLHWPDTMFTYLSPEGILFSNDVFGQHYATSGRFDDEVEHDFLMDETAKYYANIMWPYDFIMRNKIEEILKMNIPLNMIAPSHGVLWRRNAMQAMDAYYLWTNNETRKKVVLVYETMYGATARMAEKITEGLLDAGVEVRCYDINQSVRTDIIREMLDARGYIIGSSTHDNNLLPTIAGFLEFFRGIKPKERLVCAFGSYGWAGGAVKMIENIFKEMGMEPFLPGLSVKYFPQEKDLMRCYELGSKFAEKIKYEPAELKSSAFMEEK